MPKYLPKTLEELPELVNVGNACNLLGCHPNTLRAWENDGKINCIRIGNRKGVGDRRFRKADLIKMMNGEPLSPFQTRKIKMREKA